ncbi:MAG: hypothetical protein AMS24_04725 [Chlamydiae bacterium SM23_39]|nr:MAG: hypothetical protein AMS24_04725 [Chlamydiae bacterium SM23_39]
MGLKFFVFFIILGKVIFSYEKNLQTALDFFKNKDIIQDSLQYQIVQKGKGEKVQKYFSPLVKIKGRLLDRSFFLEEEMVLTLDEINPELSQAILGMKEKEVRKIFIHTPISNSFSNVLMLEVEIIKADSSQIGQLKQFVFEKKIR